MSELRPPRYLKPMNKFMMAVQKLGIPTGPAMLETNDPFTAYAR